MYSILRAGIVICIVALATACFPRYGDEWLAPYATGTVLAGPDAVPLEGVRVHYLAAPDVQVITDANGIYTIPGIVEKGFSLIMPASSIALRPLRVEAAGYPAVTIHVDAPVPAHSAMELHVPPLLLAEPDNFNDLDTRVPADCETESWQNAIALWAMARTASTTSTPDTLKQHAYEHAETALIMAYHDCASESPWTGRFKANELKAALRQEAARYWHTD